jgi:hypothetical protein
MCEPVQEDIDPAVGPCVCGDSVWSAVGHCPSKGGDLRAYYSCPRREGLFKIGELLPEDSYLKRHGF